MSNTKRTVNSQGSLSDLIGELRELFKVKKYYQVTINTGKKRSLNQNAISHAWYGQISKEEREHHPGEVKALCKLHLGLPILRADDEHFNEICQRIIDVLPYPDKLKAMEILPVTSLMNTSQLTQYLEAMQKHYLGRCELIFPEEE